jgi:hypothetical protein
MCNYASKLQETVPWFSENDNGVDKQDTEGQTYRVFKHKCDEMADPQTDLTLLV